MAELNTDGGGGNGKGGKKRAKKQSTKVDMTPLVDLAFLLLTFFVLTSTFSQPKTMRMIFPEKIEDDGPPPPPIKDGHTVLASKDNEIYYYRGQLDEKGLRKFLIGANKKLIKILNKLENQKLKVDANDTAKINAIDREFEEAKTKDKQIVIVKNDGGATYKNMIDIIDELAISNIIYYYPAEGGFTEREERLVNEVREGKLEGSEE